MFKIVKQYRLWRHFNLLNWSHRSGDKLPPEIEEFENFIIIIKFISVLIALGIIGSLLIYLVL